MLQPEKIEGLLRYFPPVVLKYLQQAPPPPEPSGEPPPKTEPVAPSASYDSLLQQTPRELTPEEIEEIIATGVADFVALSRPLIRQPELPNLWLTGAGKNTAECISCNGCLPLTEPLTCRGKKVA